ERARVAPAVIGPVAADAGDRARGRPTLVPEELLAERHLLRRDRIVVRDLRGVFLKPGRELELEFGLRGRARQQQQDGENDTGSHRGLAGQRPAARTSVSRPFSMSSSVPNAIM